MTIDNLPPTFCVAPFLQLTTHPSKSFSPCPYLGGTTWTRVYDSIQARWQSEDLESLRHQFQAGETPIVCHRCWNEESHGKRSLRQRLYDPETGQSDYAVINQSDLIPTLKQGLERRSYLQNPRILTIKNGNVCNAKCRSCHPNDSSRWGKDANQLHARLGFEFYPVDQQEKNWTDQEIDEIFDLSQHLARLELFGGEPLFNKKVISLLNRIIDAGHSRRIALYINTNGSVDMIQKIPEIRQFAAVEIGVSIDDIGQRFEYTRHGLTFADVIRNIRSWQHYFHTNGVKHSIDSITTVSILNVFYLPEIKAMVEQLLPLPPFWNLLIDPPHLTISNLHPDIKRPIIDKLSKDRQQFADLISVIDQPCNLKHWENFLTITSALDEIRSENFRQIFPEMSDLIATVARSS